MIPLKLVQLIGSPLLSLFTIDSFFQCLGCFPTQCLQPDTIEEDKEGVKSFLKRDLYRLTCAAILSSPDALNLFII